MYCHNCEEACREEAENWTDYVRSDESTYPPNGIEVLIYTEDGEHLIRSMTSSEYGPLFFGDNYYDDSGIEDRSFKWRKLPKP